MKYLTYWDCLGFECIVDMTRWERNALFDQIAGKELKPAPVNLHAMTLRARFNPQRSPEIWSFESDVDRDTLWQLAEDDPQTLVDAIRENGRCLYRTSKEKNVIV